MNNFNNNNKKKEILEFENYLWDSYQFIAGSDEAGRGSLVGPIVVATVIMPFNFKSNLIRDSKLLSKSQREKAFEIITKEALDISIIFKEKEEIEIKNPSGATKEAIVESIKKLKITPDLCIIDGKEKIYVEEIISLSIVKGDNKSINVASASIIAKVTRDKYMQKIHEKYPKYNWYENKGYANKEHLNAIYNYGICELHRINYEPIKSLIKGKESKEKIFKKYKIGNLLDN